MFNDTLPVGRSPFPGSTLPPAIPAHSPQVAIVFATTTQLSVLPATPPATLPTQEQAFLMDLIAALADTEQSCEAPCKLIREKIQRQQAETGSWISAETYKKDLIEILQNKLDSSEEYLQAYRKIRQKYPSSTLSGWITLSKTKLNPPNQFSQIKQLWVAKSQDKGKQFNKPSPPIQVDRLLVCALSPVICARCNFHKEESSYVSEDFEKEILDALSEFFATGTLAFNQSLFDLYVVVYPLDIGLLLELIAVKLNDALKECDVAIVNQVWEFAEKSRDPRLLFCCLSWAVESKALGGIAPGLRALFDRYKGQSAFEIRPDIFGSAHIFKFQEDTVKFLREIGINQIICHGSFHFFFNHIASLRGFKELDMSQLDMANPPVSQEQFQKFLLEIRSANPGLKSIIHPSFHNAFYHPNDPLSKQFAVYLNFYKFAAEMQMPSLLQRARVSFYHSNNAKIPLEHVKDLFELAEKNQDAVLKGICLDWVKRSCCRKQVFETGKTWINVDSALLESPEYTTLPEGLKMLFQEFLDLKQTESSFHKEPFSTEPFDFYYDANTMEMKVAIHRLNRQKADFCRKIGIENILCYGMERAEDSVDLFDHFSSVKITSDTVKGKELALKLVQMGKINVLDLLSSAISVDDKLEAALKTNRHLKHLRIQVYCWSEDELCSRVKTLADALMTNHTLQSLDVGNLSQIRSYSYQSQFNNMLRTRPTKLHFHDG